MRELAASAVAGLVRTPYCYTYLIVILIQMTFCFVAHYNWLDSLVYKFGGAQAQTAIFMALVHALLAVNTIFYLQEVTPVAASIQNIQGLPPAITAGLKSAYNAFIILFVVAVFLSGGVLLTVALGSSGIIAREHWNLIIEFSEVVSVVVFSYFVLADCACLHLSALGRAVSGTANCFDAKGVEELERTSKLFLLAVDIPGLLGVVIIWLCSRMLHPDIFPNSYWEGFVAGAIGLHVMFSQAALALLGGVRKPWGI